MMESLLGFAKHGLPVASDPLTQWHPNSSAWWGRTVLEKA